jgi:hypothetical protein
VCVGKSDQQLNSEMSRKSTTTNPVSGTEISSNSKVTKTAAA